MTAVFNFPIHTGSAVKPRHRVKTLDFGSGYVQRASEGFAPIARDWNVSYTDLDDATADAIDTFLEENGVVGFYWTPPGSPKQLKFICPEWDRSYPGSNKNNLTLPFRQVTA